MFFRARKGDSYAVAALWKEMKELVPYDSEGEEEEDSEEWSD